MKILSGYNTKTLRLKHDVESFPIREIELHLASYQEKKFENVFYTNCAFEYGDVCVKNTEGFKSTHAFLFKHEMIQRFFKDFPEEKEVVYVDCDTLLNNSFNPEVLRSATGFSISKYSNKNQIQGGVMYLSKEFVEKHYDDFIECLCNEEKNMELFNDELVIGPYMSKKSIKYDLLPKKYNFYLAKSDLRRFSPDDIKPYILHFHIESRKQRRRMSRFMSKELNEIIEKVYYGRK